MEVLQEYRPIGSRVLLVTAVLANTGLTRIMEAIAPEDFTYEIRVIPIQVAAWLNAKDLPEQIGNVEDFDLVIIPGKTNGDEYDIERALGVRVVRGPNCYSELPDFFEQQGFEPVTSVPGPKIAVRNADEVATFLAKTYEIPLIDMGELIDLEIISDGPVGKILANSVVAPHNVKAEVLRSRLTMPDTKNGWVLTGYPRDEREIQWLEEMGMSPDALVAVPARNDAVQSIYKDNPAYIEILEADPQRRKEEALVRVETLMQTCVVKG